MILRVIRTCALEMPYCALYFLENYLYNIQETKRLNALIIDDFANVGNVLKTNLIKIEKKVG